MVSLWWIQREGKCWCWGRDSPPSRTGLLGRTTAAERFCSLLPRSLRRSLLWPCGDWDLQLEEQLILSSSLCRKARSWVITVMQSSVTGRSIFCVVRQGAGRSLTAAHGLPGACHSHACNGRAKGWAQEAGNDWPLEEGRILLKEHREPLLRGIIDVLGGLMAACSSWCPVYLYEV